MQSESRQLVRHPDTRIWHVVIDSADGNRRRVCLDSTDLQVATRRLDALARGEAPAVAHPTTAPDPARRAVAPGSVEWALAEHLYRAAPDLAEATRGAYKCQAGHVARLLGGLPVADLRRAHLDQYVAQRNAEQAGPETRRKELMLFRASLRTVRELGAVPSEAAGLLFPKLKSAYVPCDRWLTMEEYQLVHQHLPEQRQLQLVVACFTGARRAELLRMRWEHIDWKRAEITVYQSKPAKSRRMVPLPAELQAALSPIRQSTGKLLGSFNNLYRELDRACRKVDVPRFSLNDCRRTFASWMLQGGVPLYDVSKLLGHRSIAMVQKVYGHLSNDSLKKAVAALPRFPTNGQARSVRAPLAGGKNRHAE